MNQDVTSNHSEPRPVRDADRVSAAEWIRSTFLILSATVQLAGWGIVLSGLFWALMFRAVRETRQYSGLAVLLLIAGGLWLFGRAERSTARTGVILTSLAVAAAVPLLLSANFYVQSF